MISTLNMVKVDRQSRAINFAELHDFLRYTLLYRACRQHQYTQRPGPFLGPFYTRKVPAGPRTAGKTCPDHHDISSYFDMPHGDREPWTAAHSSGLPLHDTASEVHA